MAAGGASGSSGCGFRCREPLPTRATRRWPRSVLAHIDSSPVRAGPAFVVAADLEAGGLVERVVHPSTPVQVEYRLTAKGNALGGVLLHLNQWALDTITPPGKGAGDHEPS